MYCALNYDVCEPFVNSFFLLDVNLQGKRVGTFLKDKFPGDFMNGWREAVGAADAEQVRD